MDPGTNNPLVDPITNGLWCSSFEIETKMYSFVQSNFLNANVYSANSLLARRKFKVPTHVYCYFNGVQFVKRKLY